MEDINFATRTVSVRAGKGQKDGVGFFGAEAATRLRPSISSQAARRQRGGLTCSATGPAAQ